MSLYTADGLRKFITRNERDAFLAAAALSLGEIRTFSNVLAYTGCHLTEALELTFDRVDVKHHALIFEGIKKRRAKVFRAVPVSRELIELLDLVHNVRERRGRGRYRFVWSWSRMTAWRKIQGVMKMAKIEGPQATPKGIRHGFGVIAAESDIPVDVLQSWMGHTRLDTTQSYYIDLLRDERALASRLWPIAEEVPTEHE